VHQQRRRGEAVIIIGELAWMFVAVDKFGDEVPERVKHKTFQFPLVSFPRSYREVKRAVQAGPGFPELASASTGS
jgi:hypothetical protein